MANVDLGLIVEGLQCEKGRLTGVVKGLRQEIEEASANLLKIEEALAALEGKPKRSVKKKETQKAKKEGVRRPEVISIIEEELQKKGVVDAELLKHHVEGEIDKRGKSKLGLALRIKEAFADERFVDAPGGVRLKEAEEGAEEGKGEAVGAG